MKKPRLKLRLDGSFVPAPPPPRRKAAPPAAFTKQLLEVVFFHMPSPEWNHVIRLGGWLLADLETHGHKLEGEQLQAFLAALVRVADQVERGEIR